jgi:hypothetical protein
MTALIIASQFELKDSRSLDIIKNYPDIELFKKIHSLIAGSWLVDRTKNISLPFRTQLLDYNKIPNFSEMQHSTLLDICVNRAKTLLSSNRHILFLWSGGIDSTAALIGFILAGCDESQITVVCNNDSIKENYTFYKNFIRPKFNLLSSEVFMQRIKFLDITELVVSAEHGDCVHGQDFGMDILDVLGSEYLEKAATKENILQFFLAKNLDQQAANCWYDIFNSTIHLSPRTIDTMYDYSWWVGYNWRWQWAGEKIKLRTGRNLEVETFYSSPEMQHWSAEHTQSRILKLSDFKIDLKKLIFDFDNNKDYFDNKIKYTSTGFYYGTDSYVAIDSSNKKLSGSEFSFLDYYQPDNFISQWLS